MRLHLHLASLPLKRPFRTTQGTKRHQHALVVEARDDGVSGFGEAPASGTYHKVPADLAARIDGVRAHLEDLGGLEPEEWWPALVALLEGDTFAVCAVDVALHDLRARRLGRPLHRLWGLDPAQAPPSSFSLAGERAADLPRELAAAPRFPIYKVKIRHEDELPHVADLFTRTTARLRVDANEAWTLPVARRCVDALEALGVELVEQPLPADRWDDAAALTAHAGVPIVADESCQGLDDVDRCRDAFDGVNVKLVKCGGLTPARALIRRARELELGVMLGCMVETSVQISAAAQLAPLVDWVDLDGALLLARDVGHGVQLPDGALRFPATPGTGFVPSDLGCVVPAGGSR